MPRPPSRLSALLPLLLFATPAAAQLTLPPAPPPPPPLLPMATLASPPLCGVVITVDGSACLHDMTNDVRRLLAAADLPLGVHPYRWTHGPGRVFADLRGTTHHQAKGKELAQLLLTYRELNPANRVVLVAHSSGAAVVLYAAECLPAGCLDRIILLAPAVSARYDLRPALRAAREGIDTFYSPKDPISHTLFVTGTADGWNGQAAGCVGFTTYQAAEYDRLRQHTWQPEMYATGYWGGHFGCTRPEFLRQYVVPRACGDDPRLQPPPVAAAPAAGPHTTRSSPISAARTYDPRLVRGPLLIP